MGAPTITLEGRVVGDPQFKYLDDGRALCRLRMVCVDRRNVDGRWVDGEEFWITVSVFRALAERTYEAIRDRDQIIVVGKLTTSEWMDSDGRKQSTPKVVAHNLGPSLLFSSRAPVDSPAPGASQSVRTAQRAPQPVTHAPQRRPEPDPQGSDESWGAPVGASTPLYGAAGDDPWA